MNLNGTPYKKAEVSPGKWQWVVDEASLKMQLDYEQHKRDLAWGLQSRVLTDAEMTEVAQYGISLFTQSMVSYREEDKQREMNEALLQQFRLRAAVAAPPPAK